ncbi:MAG: terpene synthase family protein [Prochloraceae cyanobacterium]
MWFICFASHLNDTITKFHFLLKNNLVKAARLLANNFVCWSNSIVSYEKEMHKNNNHNLVLIFPNKYDLSLDDA